MDDLLVLASGPGRVELRRGGGGGVATAALVKLRGDQRDDQQEDAADDRQFVFVPEQVGFQHQIRAGQGLLIPGGNRHGGIREKGEEENLYSWQ